jgi:hypothetical protein
VSSAKNIKTITTIIQIMIIKRPALSKAINSGKWIFIYGRRKTGKTFLVEEFGKYSDFFFVKRDKTIIEKKDWKDINYDTLKEILIRELEHGGSVVIDEFHRLGEDFFDYLHALPQKGNLTIISSTLHTAKSLLQTHSPILGKFGEVNIGLLNIQDILPLIKKYFNNPKDLLEAAILLQEPITINFLEPNNIYDMISRFKFTVPALIGEIFIEEDRKLSEIYEGILRATAVGKIRSGEICSYLFSRKLLQKDDPSYIQQYLTNLIQLGIMYKIPIWDKKRVVYKHTSPLTRIYYYLDEKYSFGDRDMTNQELALYLNEVMPRIVEDNIRNAIANKFGLTPHLFEAKDFEVDGIFTKFKKPSIALEVKWKKKIDNKDIEKARLNLDRIEINRKILFVPDKAGIKIKDIELMDVKDIVK